MQIRYVQYTAKTQPDFILEDAFKARLRKIAAHIELNRTDLATYESQKIVRDFGTHVTTSVDMGAALVQVIVASSVMSFQTFKWIFVRHSFIFKLMKRSNQNVS